MYAMYGSDICIHKSTEFLTKKPRVSTPVLIKIIILYFLPLCFHTFYPFGGKLVL